MDLNVIDLILSDHRELKHLFEEVRLNPAERPTLVPTLVNLLTAHSRAEEAEVYPAAAGAGIQSVRHSQQEHLEADQLAAAVAAADPGAADFADKLYALVEGVLHHIQEEECDVLPAIRDAFDDAQLAQLGEAFLAVREQHLGAMPRDITKSELHTQAVNAGVTAGDRTKAELQERLKAAAKE